jgi:DNA-binding MarR family transcriptional regulator
MANKTRVAEPTEDPALEAFLYAIPFLLPGLNQVAQECGVSIGEWIILWHLKQIGVANEKGQLTMLRRTLIELLEKRGFGDANISRLLSSLEDKGHLLRGGIPMHERDKLFGDSDRGDKFVVVLQETGEEKLKEFKQHLAEHFRGWRSEQSVIVKKAVASASAIGLQFAEWFFKGKM